MILYLLYRIVSLLIIILPAKLQYLLGIALGNLVFYLVKDRRELGISNFKLAFPGMSDARARQLTKGVCQQLALNLVEFILLPGLSKANLNHKIGFENQDILKDAYQQGKGVIIYSAHFGNWEWLPTILALKGYQVNAVARTQNNPYFDQKVNEIREVKGVNIILKGMSMRQAFRALKKGECLYLLGDQFALNNGWPMEFFGQEVSTFTGVIELARRTGALIVPAFLIRQSLGFHHLVFYESVTINRKASLDDQKQVLQRLVSITETAIKEHPQQWLWLHRRWRNNKK